MLLLLNGHFRSLKAQSKVGHYILYSVKTKPSVMGSCNLEISFCSNFTMKQSEKIR